MTVWLYDAYIELNLTLFHIQSKLAQASQPIAIVVFRILYLSHFDVYGFYCYFHLLGCLPHESLGLLALSLLYIISTQKHVWPNSKGLKERRVVE